jgi:ABC-type multidrug transport system fused ATPase/permease subunit
MRKLGSRLHRLTVEGQRATDDLAYVVEENVLAWRIVRLHGAQAQQAQRFLQRADLLRQLMVKAVVAGATMTPVTQMLAAVCAVGGHHAGAVASGSGGSTVGGFVAFVMAMLQLVAPRQAPVGRDGAHHPRPGSRGARAWTSSNHTGRSRRQHRPCTPAGRAARSASTT